ncbi:hypothetical protein Pst134EA_007770 [Puccinia striiformis f. sp. tritici]|uniref:hypothetical protein n=1 Tax=Puccinia striiformis f. sp. tritici TaxID=168172 RepID=UPI002007589F|nr:hypothetical protein Pst134EA_007770 [Puccinia striiformis f. sp. tritici]KAH9470519.1 hypothetical protein Pst134EA_007770 [Puccinia striiformis f. sp. tritici]
MERRKRRKNQNKTKPTTELNNTPPEPTPGSEFIKSLPASSLIKYLDQHHLLNSPLRSATPSASPSSLALNRNQQLEDYNRFALLVSSNYNLCQTGAQRPDTPETREETLKDQKRAQKEDQSSSISPSTSAVSSASGSSSSSSSPRPTRSSSSFYRRLFSGAELNLKPLTDPDENENEHESTCGRKRTKVSRKDARDSLYSFDHTLQELVSNHHHQSFPSLSVNPSESVGLLQPRQPPCSPTPSPSGTGLRRVGGRTGPDEPLQLSTDHHRLPSLKRKHTQKTPINATTTTTTTATTTTTTTLDHHGFIFKINRDHLSSIINPHPPTDHIRLIEDHVLSNFVYSVKTRAFSSSSSSSSLIWTGSHICFIFLLSIFSSFFISSSFCLVYLT